MFAKRPDDLRAVIRQIHPDIFGAWPEARAINAESLKILNVYCDSLASGGVVQEARVTFLVKRPISENGAAPGDKKSHKSAYASSLDGSEQLQRIDAVLPAHGSLAPLLFAFGLLSDDLYSAEATETPGKRDATLVTWLQSMVRDALAAAEGAEMARAALESEMEAMRTEYNLTSVKVGCLLTAGEAVLTTWLSAVDLVNVAMSLLAENEPDRFAGLTVRVELPSVIEEIDASQSSSSLQARGQQHRYTHITSGGVLVAVADEMCLLDDLEALDLSQARLLARLSLFWERTAKSLIAPVRDLLAVRAVWHDTSVEQATQRFALWAAKLLESRHEVAEKLEACGIGGPRPPVQRSLFLHSEPGGRAVEALSSRTLLQVRYDCPVEELVEALTDPNLLPADSAGTADENAAAREQAAATAAAESALLEAAQVALGARRILILASHLPSHIMNSTLQRLIDNAAALRASVDLTGVTLAIDDRFEVWDSGYISIPYDFQVGELQRQLGYRLLGAGSSQKASRDDTVRESYSNRDSQRSDSLRSAIGRHDTGPTEDSSGSREAGRGSSRPQLQQHMDNISRSAGLSQRLSEGGGNSRGSGGSGSGRGKPKRRNSRMDAISAWSFSDGMRRDTYVGQCTQITGPLSVPKARPLIRRPQLYPIHTRRAFRPIQTAGRALEPRRDNLSLRL